MPHNIDYNNDFIERQTEGFAFSADEINPAASLKMPQNHRMDIARPVVMANNLEIPDGLTLTIMLYQSKIPIP